MEQPPEEAPEVREEEEKEEVAETQGAAELNGEPEHSLPSSSYTGEEGGAGAGPQPGECEEQLEGWSCRTVGRGTTSFCTADRIPGVESGLWESCWNLCASCMLSWLF